VNTRSQKTVLTLLFVVGLVLPPLFLPAVPADGLPMVATPLVLPPWEQWLLFSTAFIIKPLYMTLALVIALLLRRRTAGELVAMRWAMVLFFLGELACALNYLLYRDTSRLLDYWHNYGMVCAFALIVSAVMELLDERIIHYAQPERRCALMPLCGGCYKQGDIRCSLLILFLYLLPALAAAAAIPVVATVGRQLHGGMVLGSSVSFDRTLLGQLIEFRFFPLVAALFLTLAFLRLLVRREAGFSAARPLAALGLGPLLFSLMRFLLERGFAGQPHWADIWEELTECLFIVITLRLVLLIRSRSPLHHTEVS
jgi:hypothetical protein